VTAVELEHHLPHTNALSMCKLYGTGGKKHSHTEHGKTLVSKPNKKNSKYENRKRTCI